MTSVKEHNAQQTSRGSLKAFDTVHTLLTNIWSINVVNTFFLICFNVMQERKQASALQGKLAPEQHLQHRDISAHASMGEQANGYSLKTQALQCLGPYTVCLFTNCQASGCSLASSFYKMAFLSAGIILNHNQNCCLNPISCLVPCPPMLLTQTGQFPSVSQNGSPLL